MDSSTLRRKITVLLLGVSFLASAAGATDLRGVAYPQSLQFLARIAAVLDFFWEKNGASLDPDGRPRGGGSLDPNGLRKEGASLDPDGRNKNGGSLDPDGRPTAEGGSLDPWGLCGQKACDGMLPQ